MLKSARTALIALLLALLSLAAAPALAHDQLTKSDPANGATVAAPGDVTLTYSAEVLLTGARVQINGPDDSVATSGKPTVKGKHVVQQVGASAPGKYQVTWRVTSSDGHPIAGTFSFTVKKEGGEKSSATSSATAPTGSGSPKSTHRNVPGTASEPTERVNTDETSNRSMLVIGLAVAASLVLTVGIMYARHRVRDK